MTTTTTHLQTVWATAAQAPIAQPAAVHDKATSHKAGVKLAAQAIAWFRQHPTECLTVEDMASKFDGRAIHPGSIQRALRDAVKAGHLVCQGGIYLLGANNPTVPEAIAPAPMADESLPAKVDEPAPPAAAAPTPQAKAKQPSRGGRVPASITAKELLAVPIEQGIPLVKPRPEVLLVDVLQTKLLPMQPGDSFAVPLAMHRTITNAIQRLQASDRKYTVRRWRATQDSETLARVWRTA